MTDASTGLDSGAFRRSASPTSLFARVVSFAELVAEAFAEARRMRQDARQRYPYLSDEA